MGISNTFAQVFTDSYTFASVTTKCLTYCNQLESQFQIVPITNLKDRSHRINSQSKNTMGLDKIPEFLVLIVVLRLIYLLIRKKFHIMINSKAFLLYRVLVSC